MKAYVILVTIACVYDYSVEDIQNLDIEKVRMLADLSEKENRRCGEMELSVFQNSFNYDTHNFYSSDNVYIRIL